MRIAIGATVAALALAACGNVPAASAPAASPGAGPPWRIAYDGFGQVDIIGSASDYRVTIDPARADSASTTHSALVLSASTRSDLTFVARVRTNVQLRKPHPNDWEVGWLLWDYVDDQHFYYIILKPNGYELGKEDPSYPGHQRFLATGTRPAFPVGRWYAVRIQQRGDVIVVTVDGRRLVRYVDTRDPYQSGRVGLYAEDASVTYQVGTVQPVP
jgi:hypothetical protein